MHTCNGHFFVCYFLLLWIFQHHFQLVAVQYACSAGTTLISNRPLNLHSTPLAMHYSGLHLFLFEQVVGTMFPSPPPYYALYTTEAATDPNHIDHGLFTPPPPLQTPYLKLGEWQEPSRFRLRSINGAPVLFNIQTDPASTSSSSSSVSSSTVSPVDPAQVQSFTPNINYATELRKLNGMLALQYQQLLTELTRPRTPEGTTALQPHLRKTEHILTNILHLVAILRPHQARQGLIEMMRNQVRVSSMPTGIL